MAGSVRHGGGILPQRKVAVAQAFASGCIALLFAISALASTSSRSTLPASTYEKAVHARQLLEARPEDQRTRRDFDHALDLFRAVYHDDPASPKADASIFAVAGLLTEEGRVFNDKKSFHDAIGQYEFLRREYPASQFRFDALLNEGSIYQNDLNDPSEARLAFQAFLKQYSRNPQSAVARNALKEIHAEETAARRPPAQGTTAHSISPAPAAPRHSNTVLAAAIQSQAADSTPGNPTHATSPTTSPAPSSIQTPAAASPTRSTTINPITPAPASSPAKPATVQPSSFTEAPRRKGKLVSVTGVRHWSTSIYTRVAIDLGDEVQYEAARVPDPDRIFFDLHGARLSPELIGKSVTVTDDGFLKRIRIAQFSNDVTRIVLDVSDVSDYSAFLLPNPYRLIIDIHGKKPGTPQLPQAMAVSPPPLSSPSNSSTPQSNAPAARNSATSTPPQVNPATPANRTRNSPAAQSTPSATVVVANTISSPADPSASRDIAALGHQPDRVKATTHPTTAPIAASVAGTTPATQPDLSKTTPPIARSNKRSKSSAASDDSTDTTSASVHEANPTADGARSMVRALGLKIGRIVVDAGHGGHDSGTLGPDGIEEKDVVLDVSLRLGKLLKQRLGADVIFTRSDDTFIPLETRTAIANKSQADLFVSVHANSSSDASARGVETYYLNFTSSPESLELAARENAVSQQSIHQLSDLVKKIALHDKIDESREFASDVEKYLYEGLDQGNPGLKDRGVKQAPFVVLIGSNMPSILAEISFLTNPDDARQLRDPNYRQRIAESLYRGVARYISGLSGVRLAENSSHLPGR
jgi:N-acetylmuramoyl-L-alanine amidase